MADKKEVNIEGDDNFVVQGDLTIQQLTKKIPSTLGKVLPCLASAIDTFEETKTPPEVPYEIESKLDFNKLVTYRTYIEEYNEFGRTVDSIYENLEDERPRSKKKIFRYLTKKYTDAKVAEIGKEKEAEKINEIIANNSDKIFKEVIGAIKNDLAGAELEGVDVEDVELCSLVIACHGFINCKILENVPNDR